MREILSDVLAWGDQPTAVATVIETWGSSPRQAGAKMAFTPNHNISGSVSGGCIEGAVFEAGLDTLDTGQSQLLHFGVADEDAFEAVGLACGGTIDVFVEPLYPSLRALWADAFTRDAPVVTVTVLGGDANLVGRKLLVDARGNARWAQTADAPDDLSALAEAMLPIAQSALAQGRLQRTTVTLPDSHRHATNGQTLTLDVFAEPILPSPTLIVVGGVHIAVALTSLAKTMGYRVIVLDPREAFGNRERFPNADELIAEWPARAFAHVPITRGTAIVTLTHDEKLDDPALKIALNSDAFYVGALGGRTTREKRRKRLLASGLGEAQLARLSQPIGIEIGARTPEEIALATMAQIVAARNRASMSA